MKLILVLMLSLIPLLSFATDGATCLSHGQCQNSLPHDEIVCFKVITGEDYTGSPTCRITCRNLPVTSYCHKETSASISGVCKLETFSEPSMDPEAPTCEGAISLEDFNL